MPAVRQEHVVVVCMLVLIFRELHYAPMDQLSYSTTHRWDSNGVYLLHYTLMGIFKHDVRHVLQRLFSSSMLFAASSNLPNAVVYFLNGGFRNEVAQPRVLPWGAARPPRALKALHVRPLAHAGGQRRWGSRLARLHQLVD